MDVRDLAEAHVRALEIPEAGNERVIVSAGPYVWQDWRKFLHLCYPYRLIELLPSRCGEYAHFTRQSSE